AGGQSTGRDQIKLVLLGDPPAADPKAAGALRPIAPAAKADPSDLPRRKPKSLEVDGHVVARTPELNITNADHLVMLFTDVPSVPTPAPPGQSTTLNGAGENAKP